MDVKAGDHRFVDRVEQRRLAAEMPVERGLLHAQPLSELAGGQMVDADLVQQLERRFDDFSLIECHFAS